MQFSKLPTRRKHGWLYFAAFLMAGFALLPSALIFTAWQALISGVCIGVATMIAVFMLGKKEANEVE